MPVGSLEGFFAALRMTVVIDIIFELVIVTGVNVAQNFLAIEWVSGIAGGRPSAVWFVANGRNRLENP